MSLHMWDLYTPLVKEVDMEYTYEEACDTMLKSFAPLGEEYVSIVKKGLESRWVDVVETKGKRLVLILQEHMVQIHIY